MQIRQLDFRIVVAAVLIAIGSPAFAQTDYPDHTIRIVVPLPAGTNADTLPRIIAKELSTRWHQPVIIENHPGAAQNLGAEIVADAKPDGYTLLATPQGPLVISQSFFPKLHFDPRAFVPVCVFAQQPLLLVVNPKVGINSFQELIAYAKAHPGKINFASPGIGSSPHLTGELLQAEAGVKFTHVPYKGLAPATVDLLAGRVDLMIDNLGNVLRYIRGHRMKALAVMETQRLSQLPDVPTVDETLPGFKVSSWFAFVAPPKTPAVIAEKFAIAVSEVLRSPDVIKLYAAMSTAPAFMSPSATAAFTKAEAHRWRAIIMDHHLAPNSL
jgi:tripartite-type tricarboxylate transporter receptor subunit TctC